MKFLYVLSMSFLQWSNLVVEFLVFALPRLILEQLSKFTLQIVLRGQSVIRELIEISGFSI